MVREVEEFRPKLQLGPFADRKTSENRKVQVALVGAPEPVAPGIAHSTGRSLAPGALIYIVVQF